MRKLTPVIFVEAIEPCLDFWRRLDFEIAIEVPHGDVLGFVALARGPAEVMYQTRASLADDLPMIAEQAYDRGGGLLYVQVSDLDDVARPLADAPSVFAERTTFYGAREIGVRAVGALEDQGAGILRDLRHGRHPVPGDQVHRWPARE